MDANKYIYDNIKILNKRHIANSAKLEKTKDLDGKDGIWGSFSWIINMLKYQVYINNDTVTFRVCSNDKVLGVKNELDLVSKFEGKELADIMSWLYNSLEKQNTGLMKAYDLCTDTTEEPLPIPDTIVRNKMDDLV